MSSTTVSASLFMSFPFSGLAISAPCLARLVYLHLWQGCSHSEYFRLRFALIHIGP